MENNCQKDGKECWQYTLTDSDFGTVCGVIEVGSRVGEIVIQEYSKRKLNVGKNLMLAFVWYNKQNPWSPIQQQINYNKIYNPLFSQYEEELQKYLPLL